MVNDNFCFVVNNMKNLLENVILKKYKIIVNIKDEVKLKDCIGIMMSGSGFIVFVFFDDMLKVQNCYDSMKRDYKDVFIIRII